MGLSTFAAPSQPRRVSLTPVFASFVSTPPFRLPLQETRNSAVAAEAKEIMLYGGMNFDAKKVFIKQLDSSLGTLKECE